MQLKIFLSNNDRPHCKVAMIASEASGCSFFLVSVSPRWTAEPIHEEFSALLFYNKMVSFDHFFSEKQVSKVQNIYII